MANYVGNPDYRGWLAADPSKSWALEFVGNDGGINQNKLSMFTDAPVGQGTFAGRNYGQAVNDLNSYSGQYRTLGASTTGGGGGGGGSTADPQAAAYYAHAIARINSSLGNLDPQLNVGRENITNSYNDAHNQLNDSKARDERNYNTTRGNTINDQQTAKQNIDTGVRQNTNALQRLLGRAGSGNSSAAQTLAPFAAGRAGSVQRGQVQQQYGRNLQALDTNWGDTENQYTNSFTGLARDRDQQTNKLQSGINSTRASLLDTLAGLVTQKGQAQGKNYTQAFASAQPYVSQVNSLLAGLADLGRQYSSPVMQAAPVNYKSPDLAQYNFDPTGAPTTEQPFADQVSPYGFLFGKDKRQQQGF